MGSESSVCKDVTDAGGVSEDGQIHCTRLLCLSLSRGPRPSDCFAGFIVLPCTRCSQGSPRGFICRWQMTTTRHSHGLVSAAWFSLNNLSRGLGRSVTWWRLYDFLMTSYSLLLLIPQPSTLVSVHPRFPPLPITYSPSPISSPIRPSTFDSV